MKIEKTQYGKYRVRKMINGKSVCITFDHKPSQKEIEAELLDRKMKKTSDSQLSFKVAAEEYIQTKSNVLSPSTVTGYYSMLGSLSDTFKNTKMNKIENITIQREINRYAKDHTPKTVRNVNGFISAVMGMYAPEMKLNIQLPQKIKKKEYFPTDEDVKRILEYIKGSPYEVYIRLAVYGLRRSELICIDKTCLSGNTLTINKARVVNKDNKYVIKTTKTTSSTREIYIDDDLVKMISHIDKPVDLYPGTILKYLHKVQDRLGIPRFRLHSLRHFYVSYAHSLGIPDSVIAQTVGHASTITTRNVYLHVMENQIENQQKEVSLAITKLMN